jgi:hypothetical protein
MQASKLLVDLVRLPEGSSAATDQPSKNVAWMEEEGGFDDMNTSLRACEEPKHF